MCVGRVWGCFDRTMSDGERGEEGRLERNLFLSENWDEGGSALLLEGLNEGVLALSIVDGG